MNQAQRLAKALEINQANDRDLLNFIYEQFKELLGKSHSKTEQGQIYKLKPIHRERLLQVGMVLEEENQEVVFTNHLDERPTFVEFL